MSSESAAFQADLRVDEVPYPVSELVYLTLAVTFVTLLVLTNLIGVKLFRAPHDPSHFALTTGILTYPLTFLCTDLVSELYGQRRADAMVVLGFFMSALMVVVVQIAVAAPPHAYWVPSVGAYYPDARGYQHAFESVFSLQGVLLFGSMLAYMVAQLTDNRLYHFWKRYTGGRHLWLRNNGSTMVSQLLDTTIVNSILFYVGMHMDLWVGLRIMGTIYVYKLIIAALDTPFMYLGVALLRPLTTPQEPA